MKNVTNSVIPEQMIETMRNRLPKLLCPCGKEIDVDGHSIIKSSDGKLTHTCSQACTAQQLGDPVFDF